MASDASTRALFERARAHASRDLWLGLLAVAWLGCTSLKDLNERTPSVDGGERDEDGGRSELNRHDGGGAAHGGDGSATAGAVGQGGEGGRAGHAGSAAGSGAAGSAGASGSSAGGEDADVIDPCEQDPTNCPQPPGDLSHDVYLKAADAKVGDAFGVSVALYGETLVVGASGEDSPATGVQQPGATGSFSYSRPNSGAVYVFVRGDDGWVQEAYLKPSNTDESDGFGAHVAIWEDTLVVGASSEDGTGTGVNSDAQLNNGMPDSGAVYVFVRDQGNWIQQAYIKPSDTASGDQFGSSVAIWNDTLIVGAPGEDASASVQDGAPNSGAGYVFTRAGDTWSQTDYLKASDLASDDGFGSAVAVSDGLLAIAALHEANSEPGIQIPGAAPGHDDSTAEDTGAVYVFEGAAGSFAQSAYLKASNAGAGDQFGGSLALHDETLVVGARYEDSGSTSVLSLGPDLAADDDDASDSGAAYVFTLSAGSYSQRAYLKAPNAESGDGFGSAASVWGDQLLVGAPDERSAARFAGAVVGPDEDDDSAPASGAGYAFSRDGGGSWSASGYFKAGNSEANDSFGFSVALGADAAAFGAGSEDGAAGDPSVQSSDSVVDDDGASDSGAVYVF